METFFYLVLLARLLNITIITFADNEVWLLETIQKPVTGTWVTVGVEDR